MVASATNPTQFPKARGAIAFATKDVMGDIYFANSADTNAGSGTGYGQTKSNPQSTMIGAQGLCNANTNLSAYGDFVYVGSGHAETITGAAGMTFSVAGVTYLGQGNGRNRPKITFSTSTAAQMIVSGANITFSNIVFDFTGIDAIVAAISVTGADVTFDNCEFICNSATAGVVKGILTAATADRFKLTNCRFLGPAVNSGTTTTCQFGHESGVDVLVQNCHFQGKMTQAILNVATVLRGLYDNNSFVIGTGTVAMTFAAASTPSWKNQRYNLPSGTTPVTAAAGFNLGGNYYSAAAGVAAATLI